MYKLVTPVTYRPRITFQDTNLVGNVYFLTFFRWQAECRDRWLRDSHRELWNSIRSGQSQLTVTRWATSFSDPVGATVGDDITVSMEFDDSESECTGSAIIGRVVDTETQTIGSGSMQFATSSWFPQTETESPSGPCYQYTATCSRMSQLDPLELVAWQGKCRELFLADHAPETLSQVARRQLALQTTSASMELHQLPAQLDEVRVEMRLEEIRCGQLGVRFDYLSLSGNAAIRFATGRQRMSSKRYVGSGIAPCPLPTDMLQALSKFTQSEHILEKIEAVLNFAESQ